MISLVELLMITGLATLTAAGASQGIALIRQSRNGRTVHPAPGQNESSERPVPGAWHTPRRDHRHRIHCSVECFTTDGMSKGTLLDMSKQGWRVVGTGPVKKGTVLSLHVSLPGQSTPLTVDKAVVRWASDNEFGLELLSISQDSATHFSDYLTTQLPSDQSKLEYAGSPFSYN